MAARSSGKSRRSTPKAPQDRSIGTSQPPRPSPPPSDLRHWASLFAAVLVVTALAYQPAWHGAPLWDDDGHLTKKALQSADGLRRIWVDVGATQQYYPLVHSAFWVMHRLWGDHTLGYHLVNISLHALSAALIAVLMRRLKLPGGMFAAFLFALHPVHVESVAWMTELKNTLSTPLYLGAALAYLRFDDSRRLRHWIWACALFLLALLSKTVAATLPVSLLVLAWWRRGRLSWAVDGKPLVPLFVLAAAAGAMTSWVEHAFIGARGAEFDLTVVERVLLASRAVWFYLASLVWPVNLAFVYPRWNISQAVWWQYLFPTALGALMLVLWRWRERGRGPLAALLLYGAALGPALGFVNIYPFRYAYVADHFQYTASVAAFVFLAAAGAMFVRTSVTAPRNRIAIAVVVLAPLGALTWRDSHQYVDAETLYVETIARTPSAWMAHHNLGVLRLHDGSGNLQAALDHIENSLRLNPTNPEALNTRGFILQRMGQREAARRDYEASIRLNPTFSAPYNNFGVLEYSHGRLEEAIQLYRTAIKFNPADPEPQRNLGIALLDLDRIAEAAPYIRRAHELNPDSPDTISNLASLTLREGRPEEAIALFQRALDLRPNFPGARNNLGIALEKLGRVPDAEAQYREVLRLDPNSAIAHDNLGYVLLRQQRLPEAVAELTEAIRLRPGFGPTYASLAAALQGLGRLDDSISAYRKALEIPSNADVPDLHNSLGVALAQRGRLREAIVEFREALRLNPSHQDAAKNLARALGK